MPIMRPRMHRTTVYCLLAISATWLLFCWPWFVNGQVIPYDAKNHFYPMIKFVAQAWHAGESFTWSPHYYGGFPMIADPQSAIWTPTFWIPSLINSAPTMQLVDVVHLLHLPVGAFAIFGFGVISKWRWEASLIAALTYMLAGPSSIRLEHMLMTVSYMWLAVALWRLKAVLEYGGFWRGIVFGVTLALVLIDRNHVAYLGAWLLLAYWLVSLLNDCSQNSFGTVLRKHYPVAVGGILSLILIAVPVLLLLQLAQDSNRPQFSFRDASWQSLHPAAMISFLLPEYFGSLLGSGKHWGPASNAWGGDNLRMHRGMLHLYSGVLPTILIVWVGIFKRQLFAKEVRFFAIACIIYLVYALGRYTPVFYGLYKFIPGVDLFRRPSDSLFLFGFALSLLTGALIQQGLLPDRLTTSKITKILTSIAAFALLTGLFALAYNNDRLVEFATSLIVPGSIGAAMIVALVVLRRHQTFAHLAVIGLVATVAFDLVFHGTNNRFNARPPEAYQVLETPQTHPIFSQILPLLANKDPLGVNWRTEIIALGPVVQNLPQVIHSQGLLGYSPLRLSGFERYVAPDMQNNAGKKRNFGSKMTGYDSAMANQLGLRYIISGAPLDEIDPGVSLERFKLLGTAKHKWRTAYFYENTRALARAVLRDQTGQQIDGKVTLVKYTNSDVELTVQSPKPGLLVLHDFYYPGWVAYVNGTPVEILRHDDLFRAVHVSAGNSDIVFRFEPLRFSNIWNGVKMLIN